MLLLTIKVYAIPKLTIKTVDMLMTLVTYSSISRTAMAMDRFLVGKFGGLSQPPHLPAASSSICLSFLINLTIFFVCG
jgi:hypothetical protein